MAFHFVDRIFGYEPRRWIRGLKNVTRNEGFFYWLPDGRRVLSIAVVTEALCQLGGWLKMVSTDFQRRPVLLGDERSDYRGVAQAGDQIEMYVEVIDFQDEDVVTTKGWAKVNGQVILEGVATRGYMLPLEDFDDPANMRRAFANLYRPELGGVPLAGATGRPLPAIAGPRTFEHLRFIDGVVEHVPGKKVIGYKNFTACEPYFQTHFPRKPCVPGVLLSTFMGEICQYLVKPDMTTPVRSRVLVPTFIQNVRFRKFVEPGDQALLEAKVVSGDCSQHDQDIVVKATMHANGNRVMQAEMGFKTMFAAEVQKHGSNLFPGEAPSEAPPKAV